MHLAPVSELVRLDARRQLGQEGQDSGLDYTITPVLDQRGYSIPSWGRTELIKIAPLAIYGPWYIWRQDKAHGLRAVYGVGRCILAHHMRRTASDISLNVGTKVRLDSDDAFFVVNTHTELPLVVERTIAEDMPVQESLPDPIRPRGNTGVDQRFDAYPTASFNGHATLRLPHSFMESLAQAYSL